MLNSSIDLTKYKKMQNAPFYRMSGKVVNVIGLTIESAGPSAKLGDICLIYPKKKEDDSYKDRVVRPSMAEVVGFKDNHVQLMPYENISGIGNGSIVENTDSPLRVNVGEGLLGKTLDGLGRIDGTSYGKGVPLEGGIAYSVENQPPDPMTRDPISDVLSLGVKAVDGLLTVGKGQRIGIFAGSGVGKSTLLGMFARNTQADINVIALIGERGREVREFIERDLGEEGMKRSIVVCATSDKPALERLKAAKTATSIAEYFRDKGKDVLLMMDSLTRFSMAQREIGLASGEPPVSRGYPPSVYAEMPKLLERAGKSRKGSITGLYTVLVDGDDMNEPITDKVRGTLDGHIVLNRKLAQAYHYPAIDILQSISRLSKRVSGAQTRKAVGKLRSWMACYSDNETMITAGIYQKGNSPEIDEAINKHMEIEEFLKQEEYEPCPMKETLQKLSALTGIEIPESEFVEAPALDIPYTSQITDSIKQPE